LKCVLLHPRKVAPAPPVLFQGIAFMRQIDFRWMWHALCLIKYESADRSSLQIEELLADDYSTRPDRSRRQVNAVTNVALAQVVRRVRPPVRAAEMPDFFAMINRQAKLVVNLSRIVGEVLQGRESTHSLCLLDLEQRREELQRRNQAAVSSVHDRHARLDEIDWTMNALDRSAAGLFQIARSLDHLRSTRDEVASQMILIIQHAIESLQHGYAQLADGSPAAECSADAAIGSKDALGSYRSLAFQEIDQRQELARLRFFSSSRRSHHGDSNARSTQARSCRGQWARDDLDSYLDAIDDATTIFRSAVDVYLANGPDSACWQQAKRISEQLRRLDDMQQEIETGCPAQSAWTTWLPILMDPLTGVGRLLKDMKRQVTGFRHRVRFFRSWPPCPRASGSPRYRNLTDEVCAAVDALVDDCRASMPWCRAAAINWPCRAERQLARRPGRSAVDRN
jgi:hypothetical protein